MQEDKIKFFTNNYLYELGIEDSKVCIAADVSGNSEEAYENYLIQSKNNRFEVYDKLTLLSLEKTNKDELRNLILKHFKGIDVNAKKEISFFKNALIRDLEMEVFTVDSFLNEEVLNYNLDLETKFSNIENALNKIFKKAFNHEIIDDTYNKGLLYFKINDQYKSLYDELVEIFGEEESVKIDNILVKAKANTNKQINAATEYIKNYSAETIKSGNERFINNVKAELNIINLEDYKIECEDDNLHYDILYEKKKLGDLPNFEIAKKRSHYIETEKLEKFKREILKDDEQSKELPLEKVFMK